MGWTGCYFKPPSIPEYFKSRWEHEPTIEAPYTRKCLGQAFVGRFTLYGVWECTNAGEKPFQWASIVLIRYGSKNDNCEWYYKDMDESCGPSEAKMPKSLLKKLKTPAINDYARAWRKACWQNALGLTKSSVITKARRLWGRNLHKAIALLEDWNSNHPSDPIRYNY